MKKRFHAFTITNISYIKQKENVFCKKFLWILTNEETHYPDFVSKMLKNPLFKPETGTQNLLNFFDINSRGR